ncbi:MAG: flotillin-like FloA family protein [Planctomycetota bacterium]|jgi:uncharacterized protein YqfA (UPF0365 family)
MLAIVVLVALLWFLLFLKFGKLWLQAKLSRADVRGAELIGMWLRRTDCPTIVLSRITAVQAGVPLSTRDLESHHLAGGRVPNVVRAMIAARRGGIELSWKEATARDLKGDDVLAEVQSVLKVRQETKVEQPELRYGDVGQAVSEFRPAGKVRFGDKVVDVVSGGPDIDKGTRVEVVKADEERIVVRPVESRYEQ